MSIGGGGGGWGGVGMGELAEKAPDIDTDVRCEGGLCLVLLSRH